MPAKYTSGETISESSNGAMPLRAPPWDIATIARMKAARFSGQPMKNPSPGKGIRKHSQAIARSIHAAAPAGWEGGFVAATAFTVVVLREVNDVGHRPARTDAGVDAGHIPRPPPEIPVPGPSPSAP
ncbi:hypothetical protein D3C71_1766590 [compost metagenome]